MNGNLSLGLALGSLSAFVVIGWLVPAIGPIGLLLWIGCLLAAVAVDLRRNPA